MCPESVSVGKQRQICVESESVSKKSESMSIELTDGLVCIFVSLITDKLLAGKWFSVPASW